jgi:glycosyltransferase involved in cell wall biosynthesis
MPAISIEYRGFGRLNKPLVSVIIPTYNSQRTIGICLRSIREQTYANIEILVMDKNSNDRTEEIAESYKTKVLKLNSERTEAKNLGLTKATGKYVCFIDSDMELSKTVIEECVTLIGKDEKIGGMIIPEKSIGVSFWVKVRDFERSFYTGTEIESARFFRKDLVEKVNGFDEEVILFEESTLSQKIETLGYNVKSRIKAEILHREDDFSLWKGLKKKFYYGKTAFKYKEKFGERAHRQMSIFYRFSIFLKNKRFYFKPLLALGVIVLKLLEYFSAGLGYLASNVKK